jgi:hypothetical protein
LADPANADITALQAPSTPEAVTQTPRGEKRAREHDRVRVDHPLQLGVRRVQLAHEAGERDVQDRVVERDDDECNAQNYQHAPAVRIGVGAVGIGRAGELRRGCAHSVT